MAMTSATRVFLFLILLVRRDLNTVLNHDLFCKNHLSSRSHQHRRLPAHHHCLLHLLALHLLHLHLVLILHLLLLLSVSHLHLLALLLLLHSHCLHLLLCHHLLDLHLLLLHHHRVLCLHLVQLCVELLQRNRHLVSRCWRHVLHLLSVVRWAEIDAVLSH